MPFHRWHQLVDLISKVSSRCESGVDRVCCSRLHLRARRSPELSLPAAVTTRALARARAGSTFTRRANRVRVTPTLADVAGSVASTPTTRSHDPSSTEVDETVLRVLAERDLQHRQSGWILLDLSRRRWASAATGWNGFVRVDPSGNRANQEVDEASLHSAFRSEGPPTRNRGGSSSRPARAFPEGRRTAGKRIIGRAVACVRSDCQGGTR